MQHAVPFAHLPGFSPLFQDFSSRKPELLRRFPTTSWIDEYHPEAQQHWKNRATTNPHRAKLRAAIDATMQGLVLTAAQQQNLERFMQPNAVTVITGQQVGLLGGHLYTVLKAWTAVQTAQNLRAMYNEVEVVPVFWIADNDHDIAETSVVTMLDKQGDAQEVRLRWMQGMPERVAVSDVHFDEGIASVMAQVHELLTVTEHTPRLLALLQELYTVGKSPTEAFVRIMQYVAGETGVLFVRASALQAQGLFGEIAHQELTYPERSEQALEQASQRLSELGYHAQVQSAPLHLFLHTNGKRLKIHRTSENTFQAGDTLYTHEELLRIAETEPQSFTPNVVLRPVAQDWMFPNACYVGGPGEISYLAQLSEVYEAFGVVPAAVAARHSATLLERTATRFFEKQQDPHTPFVLRPEDFFRLHQDVEKLLVEQLANKAISAAFDAAYTSNDRVFAQLHEHIAAFDPTLGATVEKTKIQATQGLDALAAKVRKAQKHQEEATLAKVRKIHALLYPHNTLQERALSVVYFVNKAGLDAVRDALNGIVQQPPNAHIIASL